LTAASTISPRISASSGSTAAGARRGVYPDLADLQVAADLHHHRTAAGRGLDDLLAELLLGELHVLLHLLDLGHHLLHVGHARLLGHALLLWHARLLWHHAPCSLAANVSASAAPS
jgi:hypothetical protein